MLALAGFRVVETSELVDIGFANVGVVGFFLQFGGFTAATVTFG